VPTSRQLSAWVPVVAWAALIFAISSIPSLSTGLGVWDTILRKGAHTTEYAILGLLLLRALGRELPSFLVGLVYAATDELHQHFVRGRHASPVDVAIDAAGVAIGIIAFRIARR
jgi:VanZ family protein